MIRDAFIIFHVGMLLYVTLSHGMANVWGHSLLPDVSPPTLCRDTPQFGRTTSGLGVPYTATAQHSKASTHPRAISIKKNDKKLSCLNGQSSVTTHFKCVYSVYVFGGRPFLLCALFFSKICMHDLSKIFFSGSHESCSGPKFIHLIRY